MTLQENGSLEWIKNHPKYLFGGVFAIWVLSGIILYYVEDRGTFGDMFGAINALFSGLAFAGLIYTVLLQKEELMLQREELKSTRGEFEEQNKTMRLQRFENTLFNLLSLYDERVRGITLPGHGVGRIVIAYACTETYATIQNAVESNNISHIPERARSYSSRLDGCLDQLREIYKTIDVSPLLESPEDKAFYSKLITTQLSSQEYAMLCYVLASPRNADFFELFMKYNAFDFSRTTGYTVHHEVQKILNEKSQTQPSRVV